MAKEGFGFYLNNGFESCGSLEGGSEGSKPLLLQIEVVLEQTALIIQNKPQCGLDLRWYLLIKKGFLHIISLL